MTDPLSIEERNGSAPVDPDPAYLAVPYDHGFPKEHLAVPFEDLDDALVWIANEAPGGGRHTSPTGRNIDDVTWYALDMSTGDIWTALRYRPGRPLYRNPTRFRPDPVWTE